MAERLIEMKKTHIDRLLALKALSNSSYAELKTVETLRTASVEASATAIATKLITNAIRPEPHHFALIETLSKSGQLKGHAMHYRNGREAKNGDKIVKLEVTGGKIVAVGVLHSAITGNDYCNGSIAPIQSTTEGACLCDCLHIDDVAAILAEKGLHKRPEGM